MQVKLIPQPKRELLEALVRPRNEILAGARDSGADGTYAHASNLGRFLVRVAQNLGENEGFAAVGREGVDKRAGIYPLTPCRGLFWCRPHGVLVFGGRFARPGHIVANIIHPHPPG